MEMQQWFPFAVLQSYKILRTAVNNTKVITFSYKITCFFSDLNQTWILLVQFRKRPNNKFQENPFIGNWNDTWGQKEGRKEGQTDESKRRFHEYANAFKN